MNSRDPRASLDDLDLDARIRQSLRASFGSKSPPASVRRQLLERAAEQPRSLRRLSFSLSDWLGQPRAPFRTTVPWNSLSCSSALFSVYLGLFSFSRLIR
jgi:hypothetical protein